MGVFPTTSIEPLVTIFPFSLEALGNVIIAFGNSNVSSDASNTVWPAANRAIFVPFIVTKPITVKNMFLINGSVVSGNFDIGIYDSAGTKIVSKGSTVQSGTSAIQSVSITTTQMMP